MHHITFCHDVNTASIQSYFFLSTFSTLLNVHCDLINSLERIRKKKITDCDNTYENKIYSGGHVNSFNAYKFVNHCESLEYESATRALVNYI